MERHFIYRPFPWNGFFRIRSHVRSVVRHHLAFAALILTTLLLVLFKISCAPKETWLVKEMDKGILTHVPLKEPFNQANPEIYPVRRVLTEEDQQPLVSEQFVSQLKSDTYDMSQIPTDAEQLPSNTSETLSLEITPQPISTSQEVRHVFFLKVHKAASTTVLNVVLRFAASRGLNVMFPIKFNVLSEDRKNWSSNAISLPPGEMNFDILCNHLVFDETTIRRSLHPDAVFIGIVREPFSQFLSAFHYYREKFQVQYLQIIYGPNPVSTYLSYPELWEPSDIGMSYTNNRMSFDFGMESALIHDPLYIDSYIRYLDRTFDLVLITERFDESMILMKRLLGWKLHDILYIRANAFNRQSDNFTDNEMFKHRQFNAADYALYAHFLKVFQSKVESQGPSFADEVDHYKMVSRKLEDFCKDFQELKLLVGASDWNEEFVVSKTDCYYMSMDELTIVEHVKRIQIDRTRRNIHFP